MTSVFTEILRGNSPGRFIWRDDTCFAILTIEPRKPGHTLVMPLEEVDNWLDLSEEVAQHIFRVGRLIGLAQREEWGSPRVGVMDGLRVQPHGHPAQRRARRSRRRGPAPARPAGRERARGVRARGLSSREAAYRNHGGFRYAAFGRYSTRD